MMEIIVSVCPSVLFLTILMCSQVLAWSLLSVCPPCDTVVFYSADKSPVRISFLCATLIDQCCKLPLVSLFRNVSQAAIVESFLFSFFTLTLNN